MFHSNLTFVFLLTPSQFTAGYLMEEDVRTTAMLIKNQITLCRRDRQQYQHKQEEQQKLTTSTSSNNLATNIEQGLQAIFANGSSSCNSVVTTMTSAVHIPSSPPVLPHASAPDFTSAIAAAQAATLHHSTASSHNSINAGANRPLSPPSSQTQTQTQPPLTNGFRSSSPPHPVSAPTTITNGQRPVSPASTQTTPVLTQTSTTLSNSAVSTTSGAVTSPASAEPAVVSPANVASNVQNALTSANGNGNQSNATTSQTASQTCSSESAPVVSNVTHCLPTNLHHESPTLSGSNPSNNSPGIKATFASVTAGAVTSDSSEVRPPTKLSRFSIIPIEEDHALQPQHSSPSGSGSNSNTGSNANTVSSSSSLISKESGEEGHALLLTLKSLGDESLPFSLTPKSIEEENSSVSGNSTPGGRRGRFEVTTIVDSNGGLPSDVELKPRHINGISESNAKALEAAVSKIMTDYWAQHQSISSQYRGSDPDLYSNSLSSGRSTYGTTCCKHCKENRPSIRYKDAETQTESSEKATHCDMGFNTEPTKVEHKSEMTASIYQNGHSNT